MKSHWELGLQHINFREDIGQLIEVFTSFLKETFISYTHRADIAENQTQNVIL